MAAGLGFKTFQTGEVLTAADTNGYLMQGVLVFASAAGRDAAITSPQEGQFAYLKDTNVTTYYTGSAWANLDTTGMTNPMTTTGDTIYSSSGSTPARLGIGTAGQVLRVNSGATAPEWATPAAGGGFTEITSSSPSGVSTVTFSSIPGTYKHLVVSVKNLKIAAPDNLDLRVRFNGVTSGDYFFNSIKLTDTTVSGGQATSQTAMRVGDLTANGTNNYRNLFAEFWIYNYAVTFNPTLSGTMQGANNAGNYHFATYRGFLDSQVAVTSITLFNNGGQNFTGGTIYLYGVS